MASFESIKNNFTTLANSFYSQIEQNFSPKMKAMMSKVNQKGQEFFKNPDVKIVGVGLLFFAGLSLSTVGFAFTIAALITMPKALLSLSTSVSMAVAGVSLIACAYRLANHK